MTLKVMDRLKNIGGKIVVAWGRKGTRGVMWKVDFVKAYDSFYWDFLWLSMRRRGFLVEWITWVSRFIASHSFLGLMNGCSEGGLDSVAAAGGQGQTRMPISTITVRSRGGCTCHV